jgi:hypothetical protein
MTLRTGDRAQYLNVTQADNFFGVEYQLALRMPS